MELSTYEHAELTTRQYTCLSLKSFERCYESESDSSRLDIVLFEM